jgi:hypothetical protein
MATLAQLGIPLGSSGGIFMTFEQALDLVSRDERFMATVYAMNTLLIHKGVYTQGEFESLFTEWVKKEERKKHHQGQPTSQASLCEA